jgi:hypothetical protein
MSDRVRRERAPPDTHRHTRRVCSTGACVVRVYVRVHVAIARRASRVAGAVAAAAARAARAAAIAGRRRAALRDATAGDTARVAQLYLWTTAHVTLQRADATLVCAVIESSTVQAMARLGASVLIDDVVPLTLRHVRDKRVATGDLCAGVRALAHALPVCVAALHVVMPLREQLDRAAALDVDMLMRTMTVFVSAIDTMPTSVQRAVALPPLTALLRHPTVRSLAGEEVRVFVCAFATLTVCA